MRDLYDIHCVGSASKFNITLTVILVQKNRNRIVYFLQISYPHPTDALNTTCSLNFKDKMGIVGGVAFCGRSDSSPSHSLQKMTERRSIATIEAVYGAM